MTMYESSCSYQTTLDLKPALSQIKSEDGLGGLTQCSTEWASYRFHPSTFEQLKQSVEKAKAALHDRTTFLTTTSAFRYFGASHYKQFITGAAAKPLYAFLPLTVTFIQLHLVWPNPWITL